MIDKIILFLIFGFIVGKSWYDCGSDHEEAY